MVRKEILKRVKDTSSISVDDIVTMSSNKVVLGERRYLQAKVVEIVSETILKVSPETANNVYSEHFQYVDINKVLVKQNRLERKSQNWQKSISGAPEPFGTEHNITSI